MVTAIRVPFGAGPGRGAAETAAWRRRASDVVTSRDR